jgi:hypothetical protein
MPASAITKNDYIVTASKQTGSANENGKRMLDPFPAIGFAVVSCAARYPSWLHM